MLIKMTNNEYNEYKKILTSVAVKKNLLDIAKEYEPDIVYKMYMAKVKYTGKNGSTLNTFLFTVAFNYMKTLLMNETKYTHRITSMDENSDYNIGDNIDSLLDSIEEKEQLDFLIQYCYNNNMFTIPQIRYLDLLLLRVESKNIRESLGIKKSTEQKLHSSLIKVLRDAYKNIYGDV